MNYRNLAAAAMLSCFLASQAAAGEADLDLSFEDRLHDVMQVGFEPDWQVATVDTFGRGASSQQAALQSSFGSLALFAEHLQADRRKDWGDPIDWRHEFESRKDWGGPIRQGIFGHGFGHRGHGWIDPHCIPAVPEPSGLALMAGGLAAVAVIRRRRR